MSLKKNALNFYCALKVSNYKFCAMDLILAKYPFL
jgi:hypothetical protein